MTTVPTRLLAVLLPALLVAACKSPSLPVVYRIDVQQGNVITQDMLDQLEPGMDKRKVRYVLGTPLIQDTFNPDRWDYYYSFQDRRKERSDRLITLWFEQNQLVKIDGQVLRAEQRRVPEPQPEKVVVVPKREEPGVLAAFVPSFLKRDKREESLERSRPELEEAAARERGENEQVAAAAPAEATAPVEPATGGASAEQVGQETEYFQRLFQGYGREATGAESLIPAAPAQPEQARAEPAPDPTAAPASAAAPPTGASTAGDPEAAAAAEQPPEEAVAGSEGTAPAASEEEKGFFSSMVDRLRRERTGEEAEPGADAPPAPREERPGEED